MARNYMKEIANMGFGGGGASGYYSNMNRQFPGIGSMMQRGQQAGNLKYLSSGMNALAQGNAKETVKSGIAYALNQNPYIAGINLFNNMTGGIRFDKALGLGPKKPKPTAAQQKASMDYQTMLEADRNRYLTGANKAADAAQRYEEYLNAERNAIRDLEQSGPSARSLAPMLGQFAAQNYASEGAARSAKAANLSRRGFSPTSGLALGAEAAVDTGLAATRGQQSSAIMNAVMDMLQQRRATMLGVDAAARKAAMDREESMMDTASTLGLKGREFDLTERRLAEARDQQMFERRQAEQRNLGQFAGQFGPALMKELDRVRNRGNQLPDTSAETARIVRDLSMPEQRVDEGAGAMLPAPSMDFSNIGVRPSVGNIGTLYQPEFGDIGGTTRYNEVPFLRNGQVPTRPNPIDVQGTIDPFQGLIPQGRLGNVDLMGNRNTQPDILQTYLQPNLDRVNPYALEGQIVEFEGVFYRKTANGWEPIQ